MKILIPLFYFISVFPLQGQIFTSHFGSINFTSDAPLELIQAQSDELLGTFDIEKKIFAFRLKIKSFDGFNSPLQKTHFYENYLETNKFPFSTFRGKVIEELDLATPNTYRAKGQLEIHGISQEVIIDVTLSLKGDEILYESNFEVKIADYEIELPRIVHQKIAQSIAIEVKGSLKKQQ